MLCELGLCGKRRSIDLSEPAQQLLSLSRGSFGGFDRNQSIDLGRVEPLRHRTAACREPNPPQSMPAAVVLLQLDLQDLVLLQLEGRLTAKHGDLILVVGSDRPTGIRRTIDSLIDSESLLRPRSLRMDETYWLASDAHAQLGLLLIWAGRAEEAIKPLKTAIRLNPYVGSPYLIHLGLANFTLGQYDAAIAEYEKNSARGGPIDDAGLAVWAASYSELERSAEAAKTLARLIDRYPGTHLRSLWLLRNYTESEDRGRLIEVFKRANIQMDRPYTR